MCEYISSSQNIGRFIYFIYFKTKLCVIGEVNHGDKGYSIVKKKEQAVTKPLLLGILKLHPVREKFFFKHCLLIRRPNW